MSAPPEKPIVFFDGVCGLCNKMVDLLLVLDKKDIFLFSPLQGKAFHDLKAGNNEALPDSIVLFSKDKFYYKSEACLQIASLLGGFYKILGIAYLLPLSMRDALYDWIARNRYGWFGKRESCRLPTMKERARFLE